MIQRRLVDKCESTGDRRPLSTFVKRCNMSIVKWNKDVKISGNTERDQELLLATLKTDINPNRRWQGTVVKKRGQDITFVELRKHTSNATILVYVATKGWQNKQKNEDFHNTEHLNIRMSMNGPVMLTFEQMNEMNLAILEAQGVLENANKG